MKEVNEYSRREKVEVKRVQKGLDRGLDEVDEGLNLVSVVVQEVDDLEKETPLH